LKKDILVTKHNTLVEASYKLTLNEQRLILSCIAQLDARKPLPKDNVFTVTAKDFADMFNVDEKIAYKELGDASKNLYEKDIRTYDNRYDRRFRWVYEIRYHKNEGKVTLGFSPSVAPYLTMLFERFTSYSLVQIASLKSVYSIRLLEFLMQFKATGKLIIELEKFKDRLEIKDRYKRFYDIKRWVIEPAIKELREKSNLIISWKAIKGERGKGIKQLEFIFSDKEIVLDENQLELRLKEEVA
jgi:plasmid replication initiation protein